MSNKKERQVGFIICCPKCEQISAVKHVHPIIVGEKIFVVVNGKKVEVK